MKARFPKFAGNRFFLASSSNVADCCGTFRPLQMVVHQLAQRPMHGPLRAPGRPQCEDLLPWSGRLIDPGELIEVIQARIGNLIVLLFALSESLPDPGVGCFYLDNAKAGAAPRPTRSRAGGASTCFICFRHAIRKDPSRFPRTISS